jgi:enoyl-CoA hydratase/carnithine racemase
MAVDSGIELRRQGPVVHLTINRPRAGNAIGLATMDELDRVLDELAATPADAVVLRGGGDRVFVSGGDLKELAALRSEASAGAMAERMRSLLDRLTGLGCVVVAALNGHALGGGAEVAVAADLRIAADDVTIGFTQASLAIMPAWGGLERLTELVGPSRALRLALTGERVGATEAAALGLVDVVVPRAEFDARCAEFVRRMVGQGPGVVRAIKAAVRAARPNTHPELAADAVAAFARLWTAQPHWSAVEASVARRERNRRQNGS